MSDAFQLAICSAKIRKVAELKEIMWQLTMYIECQDYQVEIDCYDVQVHICNFDVVLPVPYR